VLERTSSHREEAINCSFFSSIRTWDASWPLSLVSLMKFDFGFSSCNDGLNILCSGNVFSQTTLKNNFLILDLDDC